MSKDYAQQLVEALQNLQRSLTGRVNSFTPAKLLIVAVVAVCLLGVAYHYVFAANVVPRQIIFLSGPAGSHGYALADRLAQAIDEPATWDWRRPRLHLVPNPTNGYEENRKQVHDDYRGVKIGFAHDGFNASDKVKVLVPLEFSYLHVIVNRDLYDKVIKGKNLANPPSRTPRDDPPARTLRDLRSLLKNPEAHSLHGDIRNKVALGAASSGTRQLADIVMKHYGIPTAPLDIGRKYDWTETVAALHRGEIHLAFFLAEPGLPLFHELAASGKFYLLGFDDALGIAATRPYVHSVKIPKHTYGHPSGGESGPCFCNSEIMTLATRRVIVAASTMPTETAFFLAKQLSSAYSAMARPISWKLRTPTLETSEGDARDGSLYYAVHPGARYVEEKRQPWYHLIPQPIQAVGISILLFLVFTGTIRALSYTSEWVGRSENRLISPSIDTGIMASQLVSARDQTTSPVRSSMSSHVEGGLSELQEQTLMALPESHLPTTTSALTPSYAATLTPQPDVSLMSSSAPVLRALLVEIENHLDNVQPERLRYWQRKYRELRSRCMQIANQHEFDHEQREELTAALGKLDWEIATAGTSLRAAAAEG